MKLPSGIDNRLLDKIELSKRWGVSVSAIEDYMRQGILTRMPGIGSVRFSLYHVMELEGVKLDKMSPLERRRLEREIEALKQENNRMKVALAKIQYEATVTNLETAKGSEVS